MALPADFLKPPFDGDDDLADKEAVGFANKDLDRMSAEADHKRSERFKSNLMDAAVALFWVVVILFAISLCVLVWHMLMPDRLGWLEPNRIAELKAMVGGVVLSGAVSSFARKYLHK